MSIVLSVIVYVHHIQTMSIGIFGALFSMAIGYSILPVNDSNEE